MIFKRRNIAIVAANSIVTPPAPIMPAYLTAGQSNADGRIANAERPQWMVDEGNTLPGAVINNTDVLNWHDYKTPLDFAGNVFAYDMILFKMILDYQRGIAGHATDKIYIVKKALGGTSLSSNWNVGNVSNPENLSLVLKNRFQAAAATPQALTYDIKACLWHQGESDTTGGADTAYYQNLKNLIAYVRGYTGKPNLVFVLCAINTSSIDYNTNVQNAKIQVAQEDPFVFSIPVTNGLQYLNTDARHINYAGGLDLATAIFNVMLANKSLFGLFS